MIRNAAPFGQQGSPFLSATLTGNECFLFCFDKAHPISPTPLARASCPGRSLRTWSARGLSGWSTLLTGSLASG